MWPRSVCSEWPGELIKFTNVIDKHEKLNSMTALQSSEQDAYLEVRCRSLGDTVQYLLKNILFSWTSLTRTRLKQLVSIVVLTQSNTLSTFRRLMCC